MNPIGQYFPGWFTGIMEVKRLNTVLWPDLSNFRFCYGAYFIAHVFKYLAPNIVSGRPA